MDEKEIRALLVEELRRACIRETQARESFTLAACSAVLMRGFKRPACDTPQDSPKEL